MSRKKKTYPMLEKIDLANVPQDVLYKLFDFLNGATTALAIAEATARYADFIQGVTTGEKVAASILLARDKAGGKFTKLAELQSVAYFTEDKLKTLVAVFYVEAGVWQLPGMSKSASVIEDYSAKALTEEPKVVAVTEPTLEPTVITRQNQPLPETETTTVSQLLQVTPEKGSIDLTATSSTGPQLIQSADPVLNVQPVSEPLPLIPPPPMSEIPSKEAPSSGDPTSGGDTSGGDPIKSGEGGGLLGGKQVALDLTLVGRLANATPKASYKGYANELAFLGASPLGKGAWRLMFKSNFTAGTPAVPLRLDFEEGGIHVLAVMATWNPLKPAPMYVRL